jgi:hypothetical protein
MTVLWRPALRRRAPFPASTNPLLIGARNAEDGRNYTVDGLIDEVGIWDRTLSASEVSDLWNGGAGEAIVPEPSSMAMIAGGLIALAAIGVKRREM